MASETKLEFIPGELTLIGQYDSPFVRRVAITMRRYGIAYRHLPWSVWADADALGRINPLRRVPTLVLEDGTALVESAALLDALDDQVGPARALLPRTGPERREALRLCSLATGLGDKVVSLFYEKLLRDAPSETWMARCRSQIGDTVDALDADRARRSTSWWLGDAMGQVDITVACVLRFLDECLPGLFDRARWARLAAHSARCEELEDFRTISQPFTVSLKKE
jgi:glutathione S-transferase